jgi:hypothetical protein
MSTGGKLEQGGREQAGRDRAGAAGAQLGELISARPRETPAAATLMFRLRMATRCVPVPGKCVQAVPRHQRVVRRLLRSCRLRNHDPIGLGKAASRWEQSSIVARSFSAAAVKRVVESRDDARLRPDVDRGNGSSAGREAGGVAASPAPVRGCRWPPEMRTPARRSACPGRGGIRNVGVGPRPTACAATPRGLPP